jgi:hypothetical protein
MEERRRHAELLLLLLPATVHAIHPVQHHAQVRQRAGEGRKGGGRLVLSCLSGNVVVSLSGLARLLLLWLLLLLMLLLVVVVVVVSVWGGMTEMGGEQAVAQAEDFGLLRILTSSNNPDHVITNLQVPPCHRCTLPCLFLGYRIRSAVTPLLACSL